MTSLLDQIRANLDDDGPRLVYADELQGRGDPRGELIAVQCELARLGYARRPDAGDWIGDALIDPEAIDQSHVRKLRLRENALLAEHGDEWASDALRLSYYKRLRFERGFVAHVCIHGQTPLDTLAVAVPMLESLQAVTIPSRSMFASVATEQLRAVELPTFDVSGLVKTTAARLRRVLLHGTQGAQAASVVRALFDWSSFAQLEAVEITAASLGAAEARRLLDASGVLHELQLRQSKLGAAGAQAIAQCEKARSLRVLSLLSNGLGSEGVRALATSKQLGGLRALDLRKNRITADGMTALSSGFPELRLLDLTGNSLGEAGIRALVSGDGLGKLRELCLQQTRLDDDAIAVLAGSPLLDSVRILSLRSNAITDKGARLLAKSPHARNLLQLNLNNNEVSAAGKQALVRGLEAARILA